MTAPLWQILIVTLASRRHWLARLNEALRPQLVDGVEILTLEDNGERTIGEKRQALLEQATAQWVCFFDDDDLPAPDYVSRIHAVLNGPDPPDLIGFKQLVTQDDRPRQVIVFSYVANSIPVQLPRGMGRGNRLPNHLCSVRRELALRVGFPLDRNAGEDSAFARGLSQLRPPLREHFIDAVLYEYHHRSQAKRPPEEVETTNEHRRKHGMVLA